MTLSRTLMCVALLLVANVLTLSIFLTSFEALSFPWYAFLAPLIGGFGLVVCTLRCFKRTRAKGWLNIAMLAAPLLCLVAAAVSAILGASDLQTALSTPPPKDLLEVVYSAVNVDLRVRAVALLWAGMSFFGIVIYSSSAAPKQPTDTPRNRIRWVWLVAGILGFLSVLIFKRPSGSFASLYYFTESSFLGNHAIPPVPFLLLSGFLFLFAAAMLVLGPLLFARLAVRTSGLESASENEILGAHGLGAVAMLGGVLSTVQAFLTDLSGDILWSQAPRISSGNVPADFVLTTESALVIARNAIFSPRLLMGIGLVLSILMLWRAKSRWRTWLPFMALCLVCLGGYFGAKFSTDLKRWDAMPPQEIDCREASLMRHLGAVDLKYRIGFERLYVPFLANRNTPLPRVIPTSQIEDMVTIEISFSVLYTMGKEVVQLENGRVDESEREFDEHNGLLIQPLFDEISERALHHKMIAARTNQEFRGVLGIAMDPQARTGLVEEVRYTAAMAGLRKHYFFVRHPERELQICDPVGMVEAKPFEMKRSSVREDLPYRALLKSWLVEKK